MALHVYLETLHSLPSDDSNVLTLMSCSPSAQPLMTPSSGKLIGSPLVMLESNTDPSIRVP